MSDSADDWSWLLDGLGGGSSASTPTISDLLGWTSGQDLAGGADGSGFVNLPQTSFNVGPGQIPSQIYQALISSGALTPGANIPTIAGNGLTGSGSGGTGGGAGAGGSGTPTLSSLLTSLLPLLAGAYQANNVQQASQAQQQAAKDANSYISNLYGQSQGLYQPFVQGGQAAMTNAANSVYKPMAGSFAPLAGNFKPLGSGAGLTLGGMART